jgi:hypothetical protein
MAAPGPGWVVPPPPQPQPQQQQQAVVVDGRDGLVAWLRGEFAAANAIIDLLLAHARDAADPAGFDAVAAAVQRRRHHWAPVLHLQHYFPVTEVALALHHAAARQGPPPPPPPPRPPSGSAGAEGDDAAIASGGVKEVETSAEATQNSQLVSHISHATEAQPQKGIWRSWLVLKPSVSSQDPCIQCIYFDLTWLPFSYLNIPE